MQLQISALLGLPSFSHRPKSTGSQGELKFPTIPRGGYPLSPEVASTLLREQRNGVVTVLSFVLFHFMLTLTLRSMEGKGGCCAGDWVCNTFGFHACFMSSLSVTDFKFMFMVSFKSHKPQSVPNRNLICHAYILQFLRLADNQFEFDSSSSITVNSLLKSHRSSSLQFGPLQDLIDRFHSSLRGPNRVCLNCWLVVKALCQLEANYIYH